MTLCRFPGCMARSVYEVTIQTGREAHVASVCARCLPRAHSAAEPGDRVRIRAIHGDAMPESAVALPPPPAPPPARAPGQNQGRPPGNRTCDVPGCGKKHKCAGLCGIHYNVLGRRLGNSRRCATSMPLAERIALATSPNPQAVAMAKRKRGESDALRGVRTELDAYAPGHGTLAERVRALGREVVTLRREVATLRRTLADLQTEADRLSDRAQVYLSTAELAGLDIPVMENR